MADRPREWGPWSVWKTEVLLRTYIEAFVTASKKAPHRTFIDGFAGEVANTERFTGRPLLSSTQHALEVSPEFSHVIACELPDKAAALEAALNDQYPDRDVKVFPGDCNEVLPDALTWWAKQGSSPRYGPHLGPAFAYLDPDGLELDWDTVVMLSRFLQRRAYRGQFIRKRSIEQLILFPTGGIRRMLPQPPKDEASDAAKAEIDRVFGSTEWQVIYEDQRRGAVEGEPSWIYYMDLYRRQLEDLGYPTVTAIEVRNTKNVMLYHMVFASQSDVGKKVMGGLFDRAREVLPQMIEAEKERRRSEAPDMLPLFDETDEELDEMLSIDPAAFARVFLDPPKPYTPGDPPEPTFQEPLFPDE